MKRRKPSQAWQHIGGRGRRVSKFKATLQIEFQDRAIQRNCFNKKKEKKRRRKRRKKRKRKRKKATTPTTTTTQSQFSVSIHLFLLPVCEWNVAAYSWLCGPVVPARRDYIPFKCWLQSVSLSCLSHMFIHRK